MKDLVNINLIMSGLYLATFVYGLLTLLRKHSPLYFKLLLFGAGCFLLENKYYLVDYICTGIWSFGFSFASFGAGCCYAFMFSANYGLFDGVLDDGQEGSLKARRLGLAAPIILLLIFAGGSYLWIGNGKSVAFVILMLISKFFAFPASYYHLKHFIMKDDINFMITALRPCNAMALCVILFDFLSDFFNYSGNTSAGCVVSVLLPVSLFGMMIAANKGVEKWTI